MELTELLVALAIAAYIVGMVGREGYKRFFRGNHREGSTLMCEPSALAVPLAPYSVPLPPMKIAPLLWSRDSS